MELRELSFALLRIRDCAINLAKASGRYKGVFGINAFIFHIDSMVEVFIRFEGFKEKVLEKESILIAAAYLHATLEDGTSKEGLLAAIKDVSNEIDTNKVVELVHAITCEHGRNRREMLDKTYAKIRETPGALRLKLAYGIANMERFVANRLPEGTAITYLAYKEVEAHQEEYMDFESNLRRPGEYEEMWERLKELSVKKSS